MVDSSPQTEPELSERMNTAIDVPRIRVVPPPERYAVLLNARAKAWTGEVHEAVQRFVPASNLFLTESFSQAKQGIEKILSGNYDAVFAGGGDGTIVYLANAIEERIRSGKLAREKAPPVGVLRLGTGNALASYVGAGPMIEDLRTLSAGSPLKVHAVNMIEDGTNRFPFAGFGWDADILNDYDDLKDSVRETSWENYATGLGGYFFSIATRTIPKVVRAGSARVVFTNLGQKAYRLNEHGHVAQEYQAGDVLYDGPAKISSCASIPYWGFKVRMFPYANLKPGFFELRTFRGGVHHLLADLPSFWRGEFSAELLSDFLVSNVRIEVLGAPSSYQVAGDSAGVRDSVDWKLAEHPAYLAVPLQ